MNGNNSSREGSIGGVVGKHTPFLLSNLKKINKMKKNWIIKFYDKEESVIAIHVIEHVYKKDAIKYLWELIDMYKDIINGWSLEAA